MSLLHTNSHTASDSISSTEQKCGVDEGKFKIERNSSPSPSNQASSQSPRRYSANTVYSYTLPVPSDQIVQLILDHLDVISQRCPLEAIAAGYLCRVGVVELRGTLHAIHDAMAEMSLLAEEAANNDAEKTAVAHWCICNPSYLFVLRESRSTSSFVIDLRSLVQSHVPFSIKISRYQHTMAELMSDQDSLSQPKAETRTSKESHAIPAIKKPLIQKEPTREPTGEEISGPPISSQGLHDFDAHSASREIALYSYGLPLPEDRFVGLFIGTKGVVKARILKDSRIQRINFGHLAVSVTGGSIPIAEFQGSLESILIALEIMRSVVRPKSLGDSTPHACDTVEKWCVCDKRHLNHVSGPQDLDEMADLNRAPTNFANPERDLLMGLNYRPWAEPLSTFRIPKYYDLKSPKLKREAGADTWKAELRLPKKPAKDEPRHMSARIGDRLIDRIRR